MALLRFDPNSKQPEHLIINALMHYFAILLLLLALISLHLQGALSLLDQRNQLLVLHLHLGQFVLQFVIPVDDLLDLQVLERALDHVVQVRVFQETGVGCCGNAFVAGTARGVARLDRLPLVDVVSGRLSFGTGLLLFACVLGRRFHVRIIQSLTLLELVLWGY